MFAEFDWEPLAAASIGQTYRARLRTGEAVVVKVQRPGIDDVMERDLAALALLANVAQRRTAFGQGMRSGEMLAQFAASLRAELDFRREADAMVEMTLLLGERSTRPDPAVSTRQLHPPRSSCRSGSTASPWRRSASSTPPASTAPRSPRSCSRSTLDQVLRIGFFHADPHPGNIFAFHDGTLGLIDFGAVGRLDPIQQAAVVDILAALMRRDVSLLRDGIERVADVRESDVTGAARARARAAHGRPRPRDRHRRSVGPAGPRRHARASSASGFPAISSSCRARSSPSTARSASSRPTSRSSPPRRESMTSTTRRR